MSGPRTERLGGDAVVALIALSLGIFVVANDFTALSVAVPAIESDLGNSIGPLLGGLLTDTVGWRWIFFVNVPVALVTILVILRLVPESARGGRVKIDYAGIAALTAAVVLVLVALDIGSAQSFSSPAVITMLVVGILLIPVFFLIERRQGGDALIPPRVTSSSQFKGALLSIVLLGSVFFGVLVYVPQYLEKELGWSAFAAGAGLLPTMLVFAGVSFLAGPLYHRVGARMVVTSGAICLTVGVALLALLMGNGYAALVPGLIFCGVGIGLYFSAITTAAVTAADPSDSSLVGGIVYMGNIAGGSVGLGLNTAVVLAAAALATGIRYAFILDALLAVVATVIVLLLIRDVPERASTPG